MFSRIPGLHSVRERGSHRPGGEQETEEAEGAGRGQGRRQGGVTCFRLGLGLSHQR